MSQRSITLINVNAVSLNGMIAAHPLESDRDRRNYGLTSQADQELVRDEISRSDAIITGAQSMRAAGAAWEQVGRNGKPPLWVVLTKCGLPNDLPFMQQEHIERWLVFPRPPSNQQLIQSSNLRILSYDDANPALFVIGELEKHKTKRVLLFGGGFINKYFFAAGLVDQIKLTICPTILAGLEARPWVEQADLPPQKLRLESSQAHGNHVFLHYRVQNT